MERGEIKKATAEQKDLMNAQVKKDAAFFIGEHTPEIVVQNTTSGNDESASQVLQGTVVSPIDSPPVFEHNSSVRVFDPNSTAAARKLHNDYVTSAMDAAQHCYAEKQSGPTLIEGLCRFFVALLNKILKPLCSEFRSCITSAWDKSSRLPLELSENIANSKRPASAPARTGESPEARLGSQAQFLTPPPQKVGFTALQNKTPVTTEEVSASVLLLRKKR